MDLFAARDEKDLYLMRSILAKQLAAFSFMRYRKRLMLASVALVVLALLALGLRGINLGLDFTGGTVVEVEYTEVINLGEVRSALTGRAGTLVRYFGNDQTILISTKERDRAGIGQQIFAELRAERDDAALRRTEFIGAQVGRELQERGGLAMLLALGIILIYIAFRFQLKFACGAILALAHDVILVMGIFAALGLEFDLGVLAALLAVIGYSLNDTIVVSDRIRENFREVYLDDASQIIDISLRQVFGRTILTSFTTLLVLLSLCFFGGEGIRNFAIALTLGVLVGTYSSIYIAGGMLLVLKIKREDMIVDQKKATTL